MNKEKLLQRIGLILGSMCFVPSFLIVLLLDGWQHPIMSIVILIITQSLFLFSITLCTMSLELKERRQKELLQKLYDSANKIDVEYCTLLNEYHLEEYYIPTEYDDVWMEDFEKVREYLGIE